MITGADVLLLLTGGGSVATIVTAWHYMFAKREVRKIEPQPLVVTGVEKFVVVEQFHSTLKSYASLQDLNNLENRIGEKITEAFKELDTKRSSDIGSLWEALSGTKENVAGIKADSQTHTATLIRIETMLVNLMRRGGSR